MASPASRPTAAFMVPHPAHLLAMGFGTGLSPFAPGTVGTLLAFPLYWLLPRRL
jgi:phosphatidylglycerophosphatase A